MADDSSVRVAVRIRPLLSREVVERCQTCISVTPGEPQVWMGSDKTFTFDHVFDSDSSQESVFDAAVSPMIDESMDGFNITILAYGQTGSGKTYTMGTGSEDESPYGATGIIPRAVQMIFEAVNTRKEEGTTFEFDCQFLELYNEEIVDLLAKKDMFASLQREGKSQLKIHENFNGDIEIPGLSREAVVTEFDVLKLLKYGGLSRTTAATALNSHSSRSHAIFTLSIVQHRQIHDSEGNPDSNLTETLRAKIHFVDLAGSERLKRTGSEGIRAREGISINSGLLALGNVISALGDRSRKATHVPYRDSKLTRLLQDSLGGNSKTLMIACVSASDTDFMETLNTFRYANRARNIKNKVQVNYDKSSRNDLLLRQEIQRLQMELMEYKQGKRCYSGSFSNHDLEELLTKNALLMTENAHLRSQVALLEEKNRLISHYSRTADALNEEGADEHIYEQIDDGDVASPQKLDLLTDIYKDSPEQRIVSALDDIGDPDCLALAEINSKIRLKEELLEELGKSRERILMIKQQYEQRLESLESKIKQLEVERDRVLREGGTENCSSSEIKRHYETQIQEMEKSVKHLQNLLAQQKRALADQNKLETQLRRLKEELMELKKSKVSLMNKIKEEVSKHKETERNRQKQIAQLQKATRKHEMQIRQLESQRLLKDNILKRKIEEIATLKRSVKNLESRQDHFFGRRGRHNAVENQNDKLQGRLKLMEDHVNAQIVKRQIITTLEKDLERWLEKREKLNQMLDEFAKQINEAYIDGSSGDLIQDLLQEQEDVRTNISFINDNISKCQHQILETEDSKEMVDGAFLNELLSEMTVDGFRAVVKRLIALCVDFGNSSSQREMEMLELETMLNQEKQNNIIHQQLLQHVLVNSDMEVYNMLENDTDALNGLSNFESCLSLSSSFSAPAKFSSHAIPPSPSVERKARRYAAVPELLLYGKSITPSDPCTSNSVPNLVQSSAKVSAETFQAPPTVP